MTGKSQAHLSEATFISSVIKQTPLDVTLLVVSTFNFYKELGLTPMRRKQRHREQQLMGPGLISLVQGGGGQGKAATTRCPNFNIYDVSRSI